MKTNLFNKLIVTAFAVALMFNIYSCSSDDDQKDVDVATTFTIEKIDGGKAPSELIVSSDEVSEIFVIKSNADWKVIKEGENTDWIAVTPSEGNKDGQIKISISENLESVGRQVLLNFSVNGKEDKTKINVIQSPGNLIKNGDMSVGNLDYWEFYDLLNEDPVYNNVASLDEGKMKIYFGEDLEGDATTAIAQKVNLTQGRKYKFSADFSAGGGAFSSEVAISFTKQELGNGVWYAFMESSSVYAYIGTWDDYPILVDGYDGSFMNAVNIEGGLVNIDKNGVFTSPIDGEVNFVITVYCWGGNIGTLTFDNIVLKPVD